MRAALLVVGVLMAILALSARSEAIFGAFHDPQNGWSVGSNAKDALASGVLKVR